MDEAAVNDPIPAQHEPSACLTSACANCAKAVAGTSAAQTTIQTLAKTLERTARQVIQRVGESAQVSRTAVQAIEYLACAAPEDISVSAAIPWFASALRTLLEIAFPVARISEAAAPFLACLQAGSIQAQKNFDDEAPLRAAERSAALERSQEAARQALVHLVLQQDATEAAARLHQPPVVTALAVGEIPAGWIKSDDHHGEWKDPSRLDALRARKSNIRVGYPSFAILREGQELRFRCLLRFGSGHVAVTLITGHRPSPGEAFEELLKLFDACPDERTVPATPWLWSARDRLKELVPKARQPDSVEMKNVVEIGVPQFVCQIRWSSAGGSAFHKASTRRESQLAAFEEAVGRAAEYLRTLQPVVKRSLLERLADSGLDRCSHSWNSGASGLISCSVHWKSVDGVKQCAQSAEFGNREDAFADALAKALTQNASTPIRWTRAIGLAMARLGVPAEQVVVKFDETMAADGGKRFSCCVSWGATKAFLHRTTPVASVNEAGKLAIADLKATIPRIAAAKEMTVLSARATASPRSLGVQTPKEMQLSLSQFERMKPRWLDERQRLLTTPNRTATESARLRQLTSFLVVLDPVRRNEIDARDGERALASMIAEADQALSSSLGQINSKDVIVFLQALSAGSVAKAGDSVTTNPAFNELVRRKGREPDDVISELVALKLLSRKVPGRLTVSESGLRTLLKFVGPRSSSLGEAAQASLASLKGASKVG